MSIYWIINCVLVFLLCVIFAGILIPKILLVAFRKRLFDTPDDRKIHHLPVPRLGGFAFKPVVFFSIALLLGVNVLMGYTGFSEQLSDNALPLIFGFCCIMLLYMVGLADDLVGVRYRAKFAVHLICGVMLLFGGLYVDNLHGVFGIYALPRGVAYPLTALLVVFVINAINMIDGLDGLASGLSSIACLSYGVIFFLLHEYIYAILAFATLGVLVPFFYYNVFGDAEHGRKIFMGDTGSMTVGMMLCILSIKLKELGQTPRQSHPRLSQHLSAGGGLSHLKLNDDPEEIFG